MVARRGRVRRRSIRVPSVHAGREEGNLHHDAHLHRLVRLDDAAVWAHAVALGRRRLDLEGHRIVGVVLQAQALLKRLPHDDCAHATSREGVGRTRRTRRRRTQARAA